MNISKCDEGIELVTVSLPNFPHIISSKLFQHCSLSDFYLSISHQKKKIDPQSLAQNTHMFSGLVYIGWACTESNQFDLNRIESWKTTEGPGCVASPQIRPLNKNPKEKRVRVRVRVGQALAEPALSIHDLTYRASHCMKAMCS